MPKLFDYLDWRGDITFSELPLNEVDSLILSLISYIEFSDILPTSHHRTLQLLSAVKKYLAAHKGEGLYMGAIVPADTITLLAKAAKTHRFGTLKLGGYSSIIDNDTELQFSAVTFHLGNGSIYVGFRGTDDTLVGWKENLNMSFMTPVPAQIEAAKYLESVAESTDADIYVGGHSKGGNLAVYAATKVSTTVQNRIKAVYNNDGPGFSSDFIKGADYMRIRDRIRTFVPQSSVVGLLLEHGSPYEIVKSTETGLFQHDAFSWELLGGKFIYLNDLTPESLKIDQTVKGLLSEMDMTQRETFVNAIYETLIATNATTLTDISTDKLKLIKAWNTLDDQSKTIITKTVKTILRENFKPLKKKK